VTASRIQWTDEVWNPVTGCTKVTEGCRHCYAEAFANRQMGPWKGRAFTDVRCHPERLEQPLHWKRPRRVFVNSLSDLFHPDVPDGFIDRVFAAMALATQHCFQILTKRPDRMRDYLHGRGEGILPAPMSDAASQLMLPRDVRRMSWDYPAWPLQNVWIGVSVEDQTSANARIPALLQTPAAVRFVSCEPLLGSIDLRRVRILASDAPDRGKPDVTIDALCGWLGGWCQKAEDPATRVEWVIVGGESGPHARPCDVAAIRWLVAQCTATGVACFVKQVGADPHLFGATGWIRHPKGGDPSEWPEDLRVRQWPGER
jgi:protein gp37